MSFFSDPTFPIILAEIVLNAAGVFFLWRWIRRAAGAEAPRRLTPWFAPWSEFFLFLVLAAAGGFALGAGAAWVLRLLNVRMVLELRLLIAESGLQLGVLAGATLFYYAIGRRSAPLPAARPRAALESGIVTFLLCLPVTNVASFVWQEALKRCGLPVEKQDMVDLLMNTHSSAARALLVALAVIGAPLMEELIFRAGMFRFLRTRLPRWAALLIPSVLFGAAHANLAFFAPLAVLGLVFSLAYERSGRIGTVIVAHSLFNLNTIAMVLFGLGS